MAINQPETISKQPTKLKATSSIRPAKCIEGISLSAMPNPQGLILNAVSCFLASFR